MSALPPKAGIRQCGLDVRKVPLADLHATRRARPLSADSRRCPLWSFELEIEAYRSEVTRRCALVRELATNALKYGALSNGSGCITVTWDPCSQPSLVELVWRESGGPEVGPPERKGFGSHLIERAFGGQLGMAQLVFNPEGLCCVLEIGSDHAGGQ
jgi:two-component sensor histidine kinase